MAPAEVTLDHHVEDQQAFADLDHTRVDAVADDRQRNAKRLHPRVDPNGPDGPGPRHRRHGIAGEDGPGLGGVEADEAGVGVDPIGLG